MEEDRLKDPRTLDWSRLAASEEWKIVEDYLAYKQEEIRWSLETHGEVTTLEDLAFLQGQIMMIHKLRQAPGVYRSEQRELAEQEARMEAARDLVETRYGTRRNRIAG